MAAIFSYLVAAIASGVGAWLALVLATVVVLGVAGSAAAKIMTGARLGALAMLLPSFWLAIFLGAPVGGGAFIGYFGESAAKLGFVFGFGASFFIGALLGAAVGAALAAVFNLVWPSRTSKVCSSNPGTAKESK